MRIPASCNEGKLDVMQRGPQAAKGAPATAGYASSRKKTSAEVLNDYALALALVVVTVAIISRLCLARPHLLGPVHSVLGEWHLRHILLSYLN